MLLKKSKLYQSLISEYFKNEEFEIYRKANNSFSLNEIEDSSIFTLFRPNYIYSLEIKNNSGSIFPGEIEVMEALFGKSLKVKYYTFMGIFADQKRQLGGKFKISLDEQLELLQVQN